MNAIAQWRFVVAGRVQGVGFRWWTETTARELGLAGTVRNRADGTVEVHARGPADAVEVFARRLREGPAAARVRSVEAMESDGELGDAFRIIH